MDRIFWAAAANSPFRSASQATAAAEVGYAAGLAASDAAFRLAVTNLAANHQEELLQAVKAQQRAFAKHDAIRVEQATMQWQAEWSQTPPGVVGWALS